MPPSPQDVHSSVTTKKCSFKRNFLGLSLLKLCTFSVSTYFYVILQPPFHPLPENQYRREKHLGIVSQGQGVGEKALAITVKEMYSQLIVMVRKACIGVPQPLSAQQEIWFMSRVTLFMTVTMCRVVSCLTRRPEMYNEMVGIGVPIAIHSTVMLAPSATMFTGCTVGACQ